MSRTFAKFVLVGLLNTAVSYLLYASLIFVGLHYFVATTIGTVLSILFNFKSTGRLVFNSSDNRLIFRFFGVYGVNYVFGVCGLWALHSLGLNSYVAGALMLPPAAVVAYLLQRAFVFRAGRQKAGRPA